MKDIIFRVGGESGEGVISTGELLTQALARSSFDIYTFRTYPAEIKGGPAFFQVRAGDDILLSQGDDVDVLVAFNQEAYDNHRYTVKKDGVLIFDTEQCQPLNGFPSVCYGVPLTKIARDSAGMKLGKNVVVLGVISYLFDIKEERFDVLIKEKFTKKGEDILQKNLLAFKAGYEYARANIKKSDPYHVGTLDRPKKLIMSGNESLALGAISAGCMVYAGYPITPATDVMEWLADELSKAGGCVLQMEDEISAIGVVIGASYAGKKAMTATSGPGFSLMIEFLGLATMAEIPCVIVDVQRAGPSTGMPTKTEQGDLSLAVFGGHGDCPRIVTGLTSVEDSFYGIIRAFNYAELFQCPVVVLSDQYLGHRKATIPRPDLSSIKIEQRAVPSLEELKVYKRYRLTDTGISPMAIPGQEGGCYVATGIEHDEEGGLRYDPEAHSTMTAKRFKKIEAVLNFPDLVWHYGVTDPELGVIGWGSTEGVIREAVSIAVNKGYKVGALHPKLLYPAPAKEILSFSKNVKKIIVPECNFSGQYARLLMDYIDTSKIVQLNKCEGIPFTPMEIFKKIEEEL